MWWLLTVISVLPRLWQEEHELIARLGYIAKLDLDKDKKAIKREKENAVADFTDL